ncbi:uncharacterized protein LY89DRAFT_157759 [Mollisia scopiformis]|uniref:Transcription factor domain-containing protein n=1 Tax=Mollisia scopiformis TaxID=149040 RepID=A0A194WZL0_MOLSC|nr:uncharacterized protein LY89DRAFT_157759 [Mollisia scopiformis]KUJ13383.1 hypothetical protein LY89DRAFT_157759 [Mollisia scopiformis]
MRFPVPNLRRMLHSERTCLGFDSIHKTEKPRSIVSYLEEQVARLEIELRQIKTQSTDISDLVNVTVERLTTSVAVATLEPAGKLRKQENVIPLTSSYFLSASPVPYLNSQAWDNNKLERPKESLSDAITISTIPRHVVETMLKHYCEIYRPQYPAIDESELYEACERAYNNANPSDFDMYCVHIALAISTSTLIVKDEKRATIATRGLWATAVAYLSQVGLSNSWERLISLQLLTHYAYLNPQDVDCGSCATASTRLCFNLGLHCELPLSDQTNQDVTTLNSRRRLLWNSHSIDSAFHTVTCRPFAWPPDAFSAKIPDYCPQTSHTAHVWSLRQIETEITLVFYYPSLIRNDELSNITDDEWSTRCHDRLSEWYRITHQSVNLSEKIEFMNYSSSFNF